MYILNCNIISIGAILFSCDPIQYKSSTRIYFISSMYLLYISPILSVAKCIRTVVPSHFLLLNVICNLLNYWLYYFCFMEKTQDLYCVFLSYTRKFCNIIQYKALFQWAKNGRCCPGFCLLVCPSQHIYKCHLI